MSAKSAYQPPVTITPTILGLVADISEEVGRLTARGESALDLRLHQHAFLSSGYKDAADPQRTG